MCLVIYSCLESYSMLNGVWNLICLHFLIESVAAINNLYVALGSPQLPGWSATGGDPCGEKWQGVTCNVSDITKMYGKSLLYSLHLKNLLAMEILISYIFFFSF